MIGRRRTEIKLPAELEGLLIRAMEKDPEDRQGSMSDLLAVLETVQIDLFGTGKRTYNAELQWRIARPAAIFVLAVFALVLAHTDTRKGRSGNVLIAVLVFFIYANLLGVGAGLLQRGELPSAVGLWGVHLGFALLASYLLMRRNQNRPIFAIPRP